MLVIDGHYPIRAGKTLYLNNRTGAGFPELISDMKSFFGFQLSTLSFPGFTKEDLEQEMLSLAIEAIPRYNPNRNANLITFLQQNIRNRLINMCKYHAEKRRCANYVNIGMIKIRCNSCRSFFRGTTAQHSYDCPKCGAAGKKDGGLWKFYNLTSQPSQMPQSQGDSGDAYETELEIDGDLAHFACIFGSGSMSAVDTAIDLRAVLSDESEDNKSIISLICQGFNKAEISKKTGISAQKITKILERIGCKIKGLETENIVDEANKE